MKATKFKENLQKHSYKIMIVGAALTLVMSSTLPIFKSFAAAPDNTGEFGDLQIGGSVIAMEDVTNGNEVNFDFDNGNIITVTGTGLYSYERDNGFHIAGNGEVTVVATAGEGYSANLWSNGTSLNLTTANFTLENSSPVRVDGEFISSENPDPDFNPDLPANTTATFDYTYSGDVLDAELSINGRAIDLTGREFTGSGNDSHSTSFTESYHLEEGATTATFVFETLFISTIDDLVINDVSYSNYLPVGREQLAQHYGFQHIKTRIEVPVANRYVISTHSHNLTEEEEFIGNFLWDNNTARLDDPTLSDMDKDDIIGHGTLEFVKAVHDGHTYNSVEELNTAGNLFYFENNNDEFSTDGAMTLPIGTELTLRLIPEAGYQLVSFGINGGEFEPQENIGEYTFTIRGGNGHLAANFEKVDDAVAANADAVESGSITISDDESSIDMGTARLDVDNIDLSDEEIEDFENAAGDYNISTFLDISLYNTIYKGTETDSWDTEITELDHEAVITLKLEEGVDGNEVVIVHRKHDGTYEVIPTTYDPVAHTITFKTSSFSNYAIASRTVNSPDTGTITYVSSEANASTVIAIETAFIVVLSISAATFVFRRAKHNKKA